MTCMCSCSGELWCNTLTWSVMIPSVCLVVSVYLPSVKFLHLQLPVNKEFWMLELCKLSVIQSSIGLDQTDLYVCRWMLSNTVIAQPKYHLSSTHETSSLQTNGLHLETIWRTVMYDIRVVSISTWIDRQTDRQTAGLSPALVHSHPRNISIPDDNHLNRQTESVT